MTSPRQKRRALRADASGDDRDRQQDYLSVRSRPCRCRSRLPTLSPKALAGVRSPSLPFRRYVPGGGGLRLRPRCSIIPRLHKYSFISYNKINFITSSPIRFEYTFLPGNCSPFSKTFSHVLPFATCDPLLELKVLLDADELSLLLLSLLLL